MDSDLSRRSRSVRQANAAGLSRRIVLRRLAGMASLATGIRAAWAEDRSLDALIGDVDRSGFGQGFDQASRTVHMPKATIPMLSPGTAEATRRAVEVYDGIVARGGWPEVSKVLELRLGTHHASVGELRERLTISGDLDPHASAVENDIYDSYLEEAVRRFQARHGLTIDGIVHEATFDAMNVPAATRRGQLKVNIERLKTLTGNLDPRYVVCNIPAAKRSNTTLQFHGTPAWSASPTGRRLRSTARLSKSISILIGRCRLRSCARTLFRACRTSPII